MIFGTMKRIHVARFVHSGCTAMLALLLTLPGAAQTAALATFASGESISPAEFKTYVNRRMDLRDTVKNYWGAEQALDEMALTRVLMLEGTKRGIARRSEAIDDRFDDIYAQAVYKQLAPNCERPASDAAARAWFEAHPEAFELPATARLTRIILPVSEKIEGQGAMGWLFEQATAITQSQTTIDEVAARAEEVYKLDVQGDLGWVPLEGDSAIIRALAAAKQGDLLGPVKEGDFGYLFYMPIKREARQLTWEEAASSVPQRAKIWCRERGREQVQADLFVQYGVKIDKKAIRALFKEEPSQQQPN